MKAIAVKQGKYQIQQVSYNADGTSNVQPVSEWLPLRDKFPVADCLLNELFPDAIEPNYLRERYCATNCGYKCRKGIEYKKREGAK